MTALFVEGADVFDRVGECVSNAIDMNLWHLFLTRGAATKSTEFTDVALA